VQRCRQTLEEMLGRLSKVESSGMDAHAIAVVAAMKAVPKRKAYTRRDIASLFDADFDVALTLTQLFLGFSRDELAIEMKEKLGEGGSGVTRYKRDREGFLGCLEELGLLETVAAVVNTPVGWQDLLTERLKYGRGSAIKGQTRGRSLENFVEEIVKRVFGEGNYETRCRFVGATGLSTEKADFAIPNRTDPRILIEAKAYGATGSKQTDVLGDIERIVREKRPDTHLLLVTDGVTWRSRQSDLAKLVEWQNQGRIARIYTQLMAAELESDLRQLRHEHALG
jgi:hypothetical protein